MALYKRRRSKERPVSVFTGGSSPVLLGTRSYSTSPNPHQPDSGFATDVSDVFNTTLTSEESGCALDCTLTSCNTQSDSEEYDLEVSECVVLLFSSLLQFALLL